jgi:hypothetical protein
MARYIGTTSASQITLGGGFGAGNQSKDTLYEFTQSIGGTQGTAKGIFSLNDIYGHTLNSNWAFDPSFVAQSITTGGSLTIGGNSINQYDYVAVNGNTTVSSFSAGDWFTNTEDTKAAVIYVNGNLTINSGQVFTPSVRKLGTYMFINGDLTVDGEISMTGRGANHSGTGNSGGSVTAVDIALIAGTHGAYSNPTIPAAGSNGGARFDATTTKVAASAAPAFGTAGGYSGNASREYLTSIAGAGANGTSFGGGPAGGSVRQAYYNNACYGGNAVANGGAAGSTQSSYYGCNGCAGNPGSSAVSGNNGGGGQTGQSGTGGVLVIFVTGTISGSGMIRANGKNGGAGSGPGLGAGAGSGGGMVAVFCGTDSFLSSGTGTIQAASGTPAGSGGSDNGFTGVFETL